MSVTARVFLLETDESLEVASGEADIAAPENEKQMATSAVMVNLTDGESDGVSDGVSFKVFIAFP